MRQGTQPLSLLLLLIAGTRDLPVGRAKKAAPGRMARGR